MWGYSNCQTAWIYVSKGGSGDCLSPCFIKQVTKKIWLSWTVSLGLTYLESPGLKLPPVISDWYHWYHSRLSDMNHNNFKIFYELFENFTHFILVIFIPFSYLLLIIPLNSVYPLLKNIESTSYTCMPLNMLPSTGMCWAYQGLHP